MSDLYVSWEQYHQNIETLAVKIYESGWNFDRIVCLAKGGLRVGDILCRLYDKPLAVLSASSYGGSDNRLRGKIVFSQHLSMTAETLEGRVLLVDDLADSGVSLIESIRWLQERYGSTIQELRTAVVWYKASSAIAPDYYVNYLPNNPWIHQPFERYEQLTPADLSQLVRNSNFQIQS
jgi:uncharacterized protein